MHLYAGVTQNPSVLGNIWTMKNRKTKKKSSDRNVFIYLNMQSQGNGQQI